MQNIYYSDRGIPLVFYGKASIPTVTVENYLKWYELFLVLPDGKVCAIEDSLESFAKGDTAMGDHCFNPVVVARLAHSQGWQVDSNSMDMIIGRWETDYKNSYQEIYESEG